MLTTTSTPNWMVISTLCMRSDSTMPRALTSVMAMMKNDAEQDLSPHILGERVDSPGTGTGRSPAISATLAITMIVDTARPQPPIQPIHGPNAWRPT